MTTSVPFFRVSLTEAEIEEAVACLRSGWLTTGPRVKAFETAFAGYVGARHAVALNSCTAALHLALDAIGLRRGDLVLVPTMTFAATAEVVRYFDATPVMVDCRRDTLCMDPEAVSATLAAIAAERPVAGLRPPYGAVRAMIPMHYGGQIADLAALRELGTRHGIAVIEDAAHVLPGYWRTDADAPWQIAGSGPSAAVCFSFYANKCITTGGEGGMLVTDDDALAKRVRSMSLHGLSKDAWKRFTAEGDWYYEITAPGFKYNLTDLAASVGLGQLGRADALWRARERVATTYRERLGGLAGVELPVELSDRRHSWHLFAIRVEARGPTPPRDEFIQQLKRRGIGTSVHWMPLHLHPYYRETYGTGPGLFPVAEAEWPKLLSLPIFPSMTDAEIAAVCDAVRAVAMGS